MSLKSILRTTALSTAPNNINPPRCGFCFWKFFDSSPWSSTTFQLSDPKSFSTSTPLDHFADLSESLFLVSTEDAISCYFPPLRTFSLVLPLIPTCPSTGGHLCGCIGIFLILLPIFLSHLKLLSQGLILLWHLRLSCCQPTNVYLQHAHPFPFPLVPISNDLSDIYYLPWFICHPLPLSVSKIHKSLPSSLSQFLLCSNWEMCHSGKIHL